MSRNTITFVVYTHFGRVVSKHVAGPNELHHRAAEEARKALLAYPGKAWIRHY